MFRIDRNLVSLSTTRSVRVTGNESEAGVQAISQDAPASVNNMAEIIVAGARQEAEKITGEAKSEAAGVLAEAREKAEEERRCAKQEGFAEGYKEGHASGRDDSKKAAENSLREKLRELDEKISEDEQMFRRVIGELYAEREHTYSELEDHIVTLSLDVVKKIINPAEDAMVEVFESLIRNALRQMAPEGRIIIRVSPREYERFFSSGSAVFHLDKGVEVTASILKDVSLNSGDCIIDTEDETVDAGLDTQLKYIKIAFNRAND